MRLLPLLLAIFASLRYGQNMGSARAASSTQLAPTKTMNTTLSATAIDITIEGMYRTIESSTLHAETI